MSLTSAFLPCAARTLLGAVPLANLCLALASPAFALDYLDVTVQPDTAVPAACLSFSAPLKHETPQVLGSFVRIQPALDHSVVVRGKDLCIDGLRYGESYSVTVKAGLPADDGTALAKDASVDVKVPDRNRQVAFSNKTLLPFAKDVGLPLRSVNVAKAHIVLYRFNDRAMVDHLADNWFGRNLDGIFQVEDNATKVFEGSLDIASIPNKEVSTTIPVERFVRALEPGVFVAMATVDGGSGEGRSATQWFSVSDVALTSVKTESGLLMVARSLASARPKPGVVVKLFSRANEILGTYRTDGSGRVGIPAGPLRGEHGQAAKVVLAYEIGGGFAWLQVDTPSLDLSDLDVKGRAVPAGNDAFVWTDRGVYRPGETIHLGILLRDRDAMPFAGLPTSVHVVRPDGIEVESQPIDASAAAGGGTLDWHVPDNAISGSWRLLVDGETPDVRLAVGGGRRPCRWIVDGHAVDSLPFARDAPWRPDEDFSRVTVVDALGRSDEVHVRVVRLNTGVADPLVAAELQP